MYMSRYRANIPLSANVQSRKKNPFQRPQTNHGRRRRPISNTSTSTDTVHSVKTVTRTRTNTKRPTLRMHHKSKYYAAPKLSSPTPIKLFDSHIPTKVISSKFMRTPKKRSKVKSKNTTKDRKYEYIHRHQHRSHHRDRHGHHGHHRDRHHHHHHRNDDLQSRFHQQLQRQSLKKNKINKVSSATSRKYGHGSSRTQLKKTSSVKKMKMVRSHTSHSMTRSGHQSTRKKKLNINHESSRYGSKSSSRLSRKKKYGSKSKLLPNSSFSSISNLFHDEKVKEKAKGLHAHKFPDSSMNLNLKQSSSTMKKTTVTSNYTRSHKKVKSKSAHMIPHQQTSKADKHKYGAVDIDKESTLGLTNLTLKTKTKMHVAPKSKKNTRSISDSWTTNVKSLTIRDLRIKSLLGEGAFSKVFLTRFKDTLNVRKHVPDELHDANVALKVIPRKSAQRNRKTKEAKNLMWERLVLSQLDHPFIVKYYGSFYDDKRVCILMEFVIGGEILFHFENCRLGRFPPKVCRFYVAEIICALEYLHSKGYIYRDLKPENILLDNLGHIKVVDFGFAKKLRRHEQTYTLCGSKEYVAPEILSGQGHGFEVDFWSLGVLTYEFIVGNLPFPTQDSSPYEVLDIIRSTQVVFPPYVDATIQHLIKSLLTLSPFDRLGTNDINNLKRHPWFEEFDWKTCNTRQMKPPIAPTFKSEDDVANFANARFEDGVQDMSSAYNDLEMF